jgi:hypothetical protein
MDPGLLLRLLHILSGFAYFAGALGRWVTFRQAGQAADVRAALALLDASETFERRWVIPASMAVFVFGLLAAWARGWPLFGFLQGAPANWLLVSFVLYLALVPAIPLYLLPARRRRAAAASAALSAGAVTPALAAALRDPGVRAYRAIELAVVVVIAVLMITKPF